MKRFWTVIKRAGADFIADDAMTQAGAVAFYAALSLAPLLLLFIVGTSFLGEGAQEGIKSSIRSIAGPEAAGAINDVWNSADDQPSVASLAGVVGMLTLIYSASGVFAQLQAALNIIWDVEPAPGAGIWNWLRKRGLSIGFIFVILLLLLLSLVASSVLLTLGRTAEDALPMGDAAGSVLTSIVDFTVQFVVFIALFSLMFRFLPDVRIRWKDVFIGATLTSALFVLGKFGISLYLSKSGTGSAYGAAGSLIALLLWVYYSCIILFFGAELTQAWVQTGGRELKPDKHAQRMGRKAVTGEERAHAAPDGKPLAPTVNVIRPSHPAVGWKPVLAGILGVGVVLALLRRTVV